MPGPGRRAHAQQPVELRKDRRQGLQARLGSTPGEALSTRVRRLPVAALAVLFALAGAHVSAAPDLTTAVVAVEPPAAAPAEVRDPLERAARTHRNQPPPVVAAPPVAKPPSKPPAKAPSGKPKKPKPAKGAPKAAPVVEAVPASGRGAIAARFALAQLGDMYLYGAAGPNRWDCSGLTQQAWKAAGVSLPHNAAAQYGVTRKISRAQLAVGDLVYYRGLGHVGMYIGNGQIVHASRSGKPVAIAPLDRTGMSIVGYGRPG